MKIVTDKYDSLVNKIKVVDKNTNYYLIGHDIYSRDELVTDYGSHLQNEILDSKEMDQTTKALKYFLKFPKHTLFDHEKPLDVNGLKNLLHDMENYSLAE